MGRRVAPANRNLLGEGHEMADMNRWSYITLLVAVGLLLVGAGCEPGERQLHPSMLPGDPELVGGGLRIAWESPEPGTAYLMEGRTGRILETHTLDQGEPFLFEIDSVVEADDLEGMLGIEIEKAEFLLYFRPLERPGPAGQEQE